MFSCSFSSVYESEDIRNVTGDTIRPGGFELTNKVMKFCGFKIGDKVLDVGCGIGTTTAYLQSKYNLAAVGIDPSEKLLAEGEAKNPNVKLYKGRGEELPFEKDEMNGVFCECTLSLMTDKDKVIEEIYRVLRHKGYLAISDVYAREPYYIKELEKFKIKSCVRGLHDMKELKKKLMKKGFEIKLFEDHTDYLKKMMVNIIFQFGSMSVFWNKTGSCSMNFNEFSRSLLKSRPGYFLLIAQKT